MKKRGKAEVNPPCYGKGSHRYTAYTAQPYWAVGRQGAAVVMWDGLFIHCVLFGMQLLKNNLISGGTENDEVQWEVEAFTPRMVANSSDTNMWHKDKT